MNDLILDTKSRGYRRIRASVNTDVQPNHYLILIILIAFVGGFLLGRQESTPGTMAIVFKHISGLLSQEKKPSMDLLLGRLVKTRMEIETNLREQYKDFYGSLYDPVQIHKNIFLASRVSRDRLKRRLAQKILLKILQPDSEIDFIWVTAGDSSAAGYGNLFNQSYTAVLERTVRPAFQAMGLNFVARNYGMSWYNSAPELAFCMNEVYGSQGDIDILNWDFSMQDGEAHSYKTELWVERAISHPELPILFFVDQRTSPRLIMLQRKLEKNGVGFVFMDKVGVNKVRSRITEDAKAPAVRNWVCPGGAVEGSIQCDDPVRYFLCEQRETAKNCLDAKYNIVTGCESGQKSNHPGWKEHQFKGLLLAHFILDLLEEAIIALDGMIYPYGKYGSTRPQAVLDRLNTLHKLDIQNASSSPIPPYFPGVDEDVMRMLTPSLFFRGNSVCHTAVLPAQSRYHGRVTDSGRVGSPDGGYDTGENKVMCKAENGLLPLAFESSDRHRCISPKIDHKDFFYLRNQDGWLHTTVPTKLEVQAYQRSKPHGIIIICLQVCPMDRCSDDYVGFGQSSQHGHAKIIMKVDDRDVKNVLSLDHGCYALESDTGIRWGAGSQQDGQYKVSFRLQVKLSGLTYSVKISSIVVM
jgi:hypothetical protein